MRVGGTQGDIQGIRYHHLASDVFELTRAITHPRNEAFLWIDRTWRVVATLDPLVDKTQSYSYGFRAQGDYSRNLHRPPASKDELISRCLAVVQHAYQSAFSNG